MMVLTRLSILSLVLFFAACSPKVSPVSEPTKTAEEVVSTPSPADDGPCATFTKLTPGQKDAAETAYVLFKDQIKLNNYEEAYAHWQTAYTLAPAANGRVKYQFDDGVKIFKHFYAEAANPALKCNYADSAMAVYDKRLECFGDEAYIAGRKAFDYYYTFRDCTTDEEILSLFKTAIDGKGEKADYFILNPFSSLLYNGVVSGTVDPEEGGIYAQKILRAVEYGKANCKKDCESWQIIDEYSPALLENLEGLQAFYPCAYYVDKYLPMLGAHPENCDTINLVYRRLLWGHCDPNSEAVAQAKQAKATKCYTPPPPPGERRLGWIAYDEGRYSDAVKHFTTFIDETDDTEKKAEYSLVNAKIFYGDIKRFSKSREWARKAASHKANWGAPYILIGQLYASSGPLCGPGRGFESQQVVWPAIDQWERAKRIDPSTASEANKWISRYRQYMPTKEDIFLRNMKAGQNHRVGCWIQETTTIRTAD